MPSLFSSPLTAKFGTPESSKWGSFSPYGDERTDAGWPIDEMMDDVERQVDFQNKNILVEDISKQRSEEIEVVWSERSGSRTSSSSSSSFRSRLPLAFSRSPSYVSLDEKYGHNRANRDLHRGLPRNRSGAMRQNNDNKRNDSGSFPVVDDSNHRLTTATIAQQSMVAQNSSLVPPSKIHSPRYQSQTKARVLPSPDGSRSISSQTKFRASSTSPQETLSNRSQKQKAHLSSSREDTSTSNNPPKQVSHVGVHGKDGKGFRSELTWEKSASSSQPSIGVVSELEEDDSYSKKPSMIPRSGIIKCFLSFLAVVLIVLIGLIVGQWAQQQNYSNQAQQQTSSSAQQVPSPTVSPVIVVPTVAGATIEETYNNPESTILVPSVSDLSDEEIEEEWQVEFPSGNGPMRYPTMGPTTNTIENKVKSDVVLRDPNANTTEFGYDYTANTDFLVGVYYYPWHGPRFHNGDGYMRKELQPPHVPALGEYNDSDPGIIAHHMKWFRQANIGLLVTSWWGPNRIEDSNTKDVIMPHKDVGNLKIALHYETTSRLGEGREKLSNAKTDIKYMCENYFDHPNYYKIDDRPVLFIYISRKLHTVGTLEEALLTMRSTASKCGHNLYLIGDSVFESAPDPNESHVPFWYFDAVTNYDVYGSSGRPEGHAGIGPVDLYYRQQSEWKEQAFRDDCRYIPAVSPGYNDRGVRGEKDHSPLSRRITSTSQEGSLFHYQLKQAKELVDWKVDNMILVNSFNEWHEDTQIEPVVGPPTSRPFNYTKGLEYVGYGELYLDILGAATSKDGTLHTQFDYLF